MASKPSDPSSRTGRGTDLPVQRKAAIVSLVNEQGQVSVVGLSEHFGVSADTVRRDLDELDGHGSIIRTHGGAVSTGLIPRTDTGLDVRSKLHADSKDVIGALAADLVAADSSVVINGGTTSLAVARHLPADAGLKIVTNNLLLPSALRTGAAEEVFIIGGSVRMSAQATTGDIGTALELPGGNPSDVDFDIAFIGVGAISADKGLSVGNLREAALFRDMLSRSRRRVILADSSKFGRSTFARVGRLDLADTLVTDGKIPADLQRALKEAGIQVITPI